MKQKLVQKVEKDKSVYIEGYMEFIVIKKYVKRRESQVCINVYRKNTYC